MKHRRAHPDAVPQAELPTAYGQTRLTLLDVDPFHIHASWEITPRTRAAAEKKPSARAEAFIWALRFHDEQDGSSFDIPINPDAHSWYVELLAADKHYHAELGTCSASGVFEAVCRSNPLSTPPAAPAAQQEPQWAKVTGTPGQARAAAAPEAEQPREGRQQKAEVRDQGEVAPEAFPLAEPPHADVMTPVESTEALELPATMAVVLEEKPAATTATVPSLSSDSVSSFSMGGRAEKAALELELNAEVIVYGRAQPGQTLRVNGRSVPVNDDGTFHVRWALPVAKP